MVFMVDRAAGNFDESKDNKTDPNESASAVNSLRGEYLSSEKKPLLSAHQRDEDDAVEFKARYQNSNFVLDAPKPGQGPYQILKEMAEQKRIKLRDDELLPEARRIRDRDFKEWGREFYTKDDVSARWTATEIDERVALAAKKVKGIDVSMWQGDIDWQKVKDSGVKFTFIRATKGSDLVDPKFEQNRKGAHDVGLAVGYYHYFKPDQPVADQIKAFVSTVGTVEKDNLRLVIDTENAKLWEPFTQEQRLKMIDDWCNGIKKELGVTPEVMIYGSPSFFDDTLKSAPELSKHDLWIANYKVPEPRVPKPWTTWKFWQYSETGKVPGIDGNVDLDMYNGTDLNGSGSTENQSPKPKGPSHSHKHKHKHNH